MMNGINYYSRVVGIRGVTAAIKGKVTRMPAWLEINRADVRFPFFLRMPSSDAATFEQIFIKQEYDFDVKRTPKTIIDAGANIGLAAIYFSSKFPEAKIIAVEPEDSNFEILKKNVAPYGNIVPLRAALWHENAQINLMDPGLGKWGFMTQEQDGHEQAYGEVVHKVQGMTVDSIMRQYGIEHIDILKVDIEGAEREIFQDPSAWIGETDALIIELHEHMKPGCHRSFYNGSNGFDEEWRQGENVFLTRNRGCVTRRR